MMEIYIRNFKRIARVLFVPLMLAAFLFFVIHYKEWMLGIIQEYIGDNAQLSIQFWSSLFADLIVLVLATFFIPWFLEQRRRPKLELINFRLATKGEICIHKTDDGHYEGVIQLFIRNEGKFTEKEFYWHLATPKELNTKLINEKKEELLPLTIKDVSFDEVEEDYLKQCHMFFEKFDSPIYPDRGHYFPYEIRTKSSTKERRVYNIYYYFSTDRGICPTLPRFLTKATFRFFKNLVRLAFARKIPPSDPIRTLQGYIQDRNDIFLGSITVRFCDDIH